MMKNISRLLAKASVQVVGRLSDAKYANLLLFHHRSQMYNWLDARDCVVASG